MTHVSNIRLRTLASILSLILAIMVLYWDNSQWLYSQWITDKAYSHGFFIPFVSLYLIWCKKDFFEIIPAKPNRFIGYLCIGCCLFLLLIGRVGAIIQLEAFSFFLIIPSIILLLYGWNYLRISLFPILYLQLMIPWMDPILERMHRPFQIVTAKIGSALLQLKYPVYTDDLHINLPSISMVVARECSGISFLISVIAVGLPLVYLTQKNWIRAVSVVFIGCILTVLSNGLRVAVAGYFGENFGPEMLHGPAHIFQGWSVAWFGWIGLFIVNWIFSNLPYPHGEPKYCLFEKWRNVRCEPLATTRIYSSQTSAFASLLAVLLGAALYLNLVAMPQPVSLVSPLAAIPSNISTFSSQQCEDPTLATFFPNLDESLCRIYRDSSQQQEVILFIGYYKNQDNNKRLTSFLSKPLHDGGEVLPLPLKGNTFNVTSSSLLLNDTRYRTLFWYQFPGTAKIADRLHAKLQILQSGILHRHNNGAIVFLASPQRSDSQRDNETVGTLQSFAAEVSPIVDGLLP
ncbi:exosortase W [Desulfopila aestuarii]|uniref:Exosortase n=1 Tax=Desulfopila aestuarii DSM 18488 TaxID=1121416 RepID=A0A1M7YG47_9BACT|nr:exosortase W [Desulfopila aestuarii]SHO51488.1 exosortase [Desulfopila aestuarii DSM 18488]